MLPYQLVAVTSVRANRFGGSACYQRNPAIGDIGTILEVHSTPESAYEVECSDPTDGSTIWLEAMYSEEISPAQSGKPCIEIYAWRPGLEKISHTQLLQKFANMGLKQAHDSTHALLDGVLLSFEVADIDTAKLALTEFRAIGACARAVLHNQSSA